MKQPFPMRHGLKFHQKGPAVFLTALLLTLLLSESARERGGAISTDITSCRSPTLLQQLASFVALREVAEEEQLDWDAPLVLGAAKAIHSICPSREEGKRRKRK
ncbi:hypothetical protein LSM04_009165 [Trypanosoma melophagium]|uniref:uncharacterized protein n=1 Tax=Trypanosoma melophagium TaxID=715481 RepID=UPI00351A81E3|nr:hypothetical protein LSM04_009165 [Trypanosoma melophagium]